VRHWREQNAKKEAMRIFVADGKKRGEASMKGEAWISRRVG